MQEQSFYPSLGNLISLDQLPEALSFLEEPADKLLSSLFFKDYFQSFSPSKDVGYLSLTIVGGKSLGFEFPGTGLKFLINPPRTLGTVGSNFPIDIRYSWQLLKFVNDFKLSGFSWHPH